MNIEQTLTNRYPKLVDHPFRFISRPLFGMLRMLFHEREINQFLKDNQDLSGFAFVEKVLDHFDFGYSVSNREKQNIPTSGRVVIIANHPLGSLDGLALIQLVSEIRSDVKVVANDLLAQLEPLHDLLLPVDNLSGAGKQSQIKAIQNALLEEQAVIFFPAGEVSRLRPNGVRDGKWSSGFLRFARRTNAPVLPVHIKARNSSLFYGTSIIFKPLAALLLVREMFVQRARTINFRVGEIIPNEVLQQSKFSVKLMVRMAKRHVYRIGKGKRGVFSTERGIAHPQPRQLLKSELRNASLLGSTRDDKAIYLVDHSADSAIIKEIGRLREFTFRKVGEGTGKQRDLDNYDRDYRHLVLWDNDNLEIVGAYRIGEAGKIIKRHGLDGLYTHTLFNLENLEEGCLEQALELGRSFVQPRYWGSRALDYLWQGIGAYLRHNTEIRYLYGPVSISQSYPKAARDILVYYYNLHFAKEDKPIESRRPYFLDKTSSEEFHHIMPGEDAQQDFKAMRNYLEALGFTVPTLYKQYSEVTEPGGTEFLGFNVDPDFSNVVDGLVCVDLEQLKPAKRKRYIGSGSE